MNLLITLGESLPHVQGQTLSFSILPETKITTVKSLQKQSNTVTAIKIAHPAQLGPIVFGMRLLQMSNMESGAECHTEKETLLSENGKRTTREN